MVDLHNLTTREALQGMVKLWRDYADATPIETMRDRWRAGHYAGCPRELAGVIVAGKGTTQREQGV